MLILIVCGYFYPINVFIWQKNHFVDKYVQNAKFSKWQKSNLQGTILAQNLTQAFSCNVCNKECICRCDLL